jgi:hypothetical protein
MEKQEDGLGDDPLKELTMPAEAVMMKLIQNDCQNLLETAVKV